MPAPKVKPFQSPIKGDAVLVKWVDSAHRDGWNLVSQLKEKSCLEVVSIGWLLHMDPSSITIYSHRGIDDAGESEQVHCPMSIPFKAINSLTVLDI